MKYAKLTKITFNILKYSIYLNVIGYRYIFLTNSFKIHSAIKIYKYKFFILFFIKSFINYKLLKK